MQNRELPTLAKKYLGTLTAFPGRTTGSSGNRAAADFLAAVFGETGMLVSRPAFPCLDWTGESAALTIGGRIRQLFPGPFSDPCRVAGPLAVADSLESLRALDCRGRIVLLHGPVAARQLLPKHFPFLSLEEHQEILRLLENGGARAVIAATGIDPEMAGGLAPFPLIEDGDFLLPHAYLAEADAAGLPECAGEQAVLEIRARRTLAEGCNVTARCGETSAGRLIVTAHFDAKPGSPGALDNAGGVVVLLLLAILLRDYRAAPAIELVAINGEDYYSSPGELCFLAENADGLDDVLLGINIDGVGLKNAKTAFSLYDCPPPATSRIRGAFRTTSGLQEGPAWYQGDHALFLQHGRPALALTTADSGTLFAVAHTAEDRPELIDPAILVRTARALHALLESFSAPPHKRV